jgi:hypothetical protein
MSRLAEVRHLLTVQEAAEFLNMSASWLNKERSKYARGNGPSFVKIGRRALYHPDDLIAYVTAHTKEKM